MAFPQTPLDVDTRIKVGSTWTDVTVESYSRVPIRIECGRSEESVRTTPSKCSIELDNRTGKFSARNPSSPWYGQIGRNTPVEVAVNAGHTYLACTGALGSGASTPDAAALDITGDIDIRVDATLDNWVTEGSLLSVDLCGKYSTTGNQRSWMLQSRDGKPRLEWSPDGTTTLGATSTVTPTLPVSLRMAWRVTLDVNNGAGGWTATFYTAPTMAGPWTQLGTTVTGVGVTSIFNSTTILKVGDATNLSYAKPAGQIHAFELRNGIAGSLVASPTFTSQTPGATSFTDGTGKVWTILGASSLSNRQIRFVGDISAWPIRWDVSGKDIWVPAEAGGMMRRLGQGQKPLASTLRRRIPAYTPLAYWPCEDDNGATQAYSPISGVAPLQVNRWQFAQDDTLTGSSALPAVEAGGTMRANVPPPGGASTQWSTHILYAVDSAPGTDQEFFAWTSLGTVRRWRILMRTGLATIQGYASDGTLNVNQTVAVGADVFSGWQRIQFRVVQNGGNIDWSIDWYNIGGAAGGFDASVAGTVGQVTSINTTFGTGLSGLRVGHISVLSVGDAVGAALPYQDADHGYNGETASARMQRLADEESASVTLALFDGDPSLDSEALGPQRPDTLLDLLQGAADCDGGILYEDRARSRLVYRDRTTLYNQTPALTLNYAADREIGPPLEPVEDDQRTRNDVTVQRSGGSSGRAVLESGPLSVQAPPLGVGLYDESVTLNLAIDDQPEQIAGWRLHLGTWDEARYPSVRLMLHAAPHLIPAVLALNIGDKIRITNTPPWLPPGPIDLIVQGWSEVIDLYTWDIVLNCTPAGPWTVGTVDDAVLGRVDTDGCTLGSGVSSSATSLSLVSSPGPRWIDSATYAGDFPFDLLIGGERVTVTAITGTTLTQTATVTRSVNGVSKSHSAGAVVQLADPMYLPL